MMTVLEVAADFLYDPYVYWGLPLLMAVVLEVATLLRSRGNRRR